MENLLTLHLERQRAARLQPQPSVGRANCPIMARRNLQNLRGAARRVRSLFHMSVGQPGGGGGSMFAPLSQEEKKELSATSTANLPKVLASLLREHKTRVMDLFRAIDTNTDGMVTRQELESALLQMQINFTEGDLDELFSTLDPDGSKGIDFRELQRALNGTGAKLRRASAAILTTMAMGEASQRTSLANGRNGRPATAMPSMGKKPGLKPQTSSAEVARLRRERELMEAAKALDPGNRTTLEKCIEIVRRFAMDARTVHSPSQLLQLAASNGAAAHSEAAAAPALDSLTVDHANEAAAEQAFTALRVVAAAADSSLQSLLCRQLYARAITHEAQRTQPFVARPPSPLGNAHVTRPRTAPAATRSWMPQRWWHPLPPRILPPGGTAAESCSLQSLGASPRRPLPSPRGITWDAQ